MTVANFLEKVAEFKAAGVAVQSESYAIAAEEGLYIDSLYVPATAEQTNLIVLTTGVHGIEGYIGSVMLDVFWKEVYPSLNAENTGVLVVANVNPYGMKYHRRYNENNVDLNRNFPVKKFNVGGKKGAEGYSGPKALSEPETVAVANLTKKLKKEKKLCGVINYHAMGNIIYGSCESRKISKDTKTMYRIAKAETGYKRAISSNSTSPGGQYREYVMYMLNLPSITIEVGSTSAPCSYWQYEPEFQKNKLVVLKIAKAL